MTRARKVVLGSAVTAAVLVLAGLGATAYLGRERPAYNVGADGIALSGYDPVSYFPEGGGRARRGSAAFTAQHAGRRYLFVSAANRDRFAADPERYEPEFGGWCTYAVANGYKFEVDPESYLLEDGRLLLFYRGLLGDARSEFQKQGVAAGIRDADANWPALAAQG
jgi:YHS domain-containing protein